MTQLCAYQPAGTHADGRTDYVCARCGHTRSSAQPAGRLFRECLGPPRPEIVAGEPPARGLGDALAGWIDRADALVQRISGARLRLKPRGPCRCESRRSLLNRLVPFAAQPAPSVVRPLWLRFSHGFGDAVQLTTVLLHLRHYFPDWPIDIACKQGCGSLFAGLCRSVHPLDGPPPVDAQALTLPWPEPEQCYVDSPSTKAERALREFFQIVPQAELCRYSVTPSAADKAAAAAYLAEVSATAQRGARRHAALQARFPVVLLHYQGNSARSAKNLDEREVVRLCDQIRAAGRAVVILDWDRRSALVDQTTVFCPAADHPLWNGLGTGDGGPLAALISQAEFFIGIDSGPLHVAGATNTPCLAVWRAHHPLHYFGLAGNVLHLVPAEHAQLLGANRADGERYFAQAYRFRRYLDLRTTLHASVAAALDRTALGQGAVQDAHRLVA